MNWRSSLGASASLAGICCALFLAGCGGAQASTTGSATCSGSSPHAEVVVELGSGKVIDRCVDFKGRELAGEAALKRSRIEFATQHFSFGDAVCQIDNDPRTYSDCFGTGQPYWELFLWSGKGPWKEAQTGISEVELKSGNALGWRLVPAQGNTSPPPRPPKS